MNTMSAPTALPNLKGLRDTLLDMLGRDVQITPSEPWAPTLRDPGAVAVYIDDGWQPRAFISCCLPLSVALGASLALIPAQAAAGCLESGRLTEDLAENLNEVLNILAALFNLPDRPHLKLSAVHLPGSPPPVDISARLRAFGKREDVRIDVAGYGDGRLSVVLV
jgi:hypothetical protein